MRGSDVVKLRQSRTTSGALGHIPSSFVDELDGASGRAEPDELSTEHSVPHTGTGPGSGGRYKRM